MPSLPEARVNEIIELGLRHRGRHDEALRAFHAGAALRFDILMDIGGFRDMHRHRRCVQIKQGFTARHGYETPDAGDAAGLAEAGVMGDYQAAIEAAHAASRQIAAAGAGGCLSGALSASPGHARAVLVQDGFRRSAVHLRAALGARPATSVIAASPGRCSWPLQRQHPALAGTSG